MGVGKLQGQANAFDGAQLRMLVLDDHLPGPDVRIFLHLRNIQHRRQADIRHPHQVDPLVAGPVLEHPGHLDLELFILFPVGIVTVFPRRLVDDLAEFLPKFRFQRSQGDILAVLALVNAVDRQAAGEGHLPGGR